MIKVRNLIALGTVVFVGALAACGGGGGGGSSVPGASTGTGTGTTNTGGGGITLGANQAVAQFSITVPASSGSGSSSARRAQTIAAGTASITLQLLQNNGNAVSPPVTQGPFNLTAGAPGCSGASVSPVTCTFQIAAPAGNDVYLATTFNSSGTALGSGAVALDVVLNTTNTANLTLTGPVQSVLVVSNNAAFSDSLWNGVGYFYPYTWTQYISDAVARRSAPQVLASSSPTPTPTAPSSERLYVIAEDASGDQILNPTTYNQPIVLTAAFTNTYYNGYYTYSGPANVLLTDTPPSGIGSGTQSGSSVQVYSPGDVTTASLIPTINSPEYCCGYIYLNFAFITASLASPPPGFAPYTLNLTAEVVPTPAPTPTPVPTGSPVPTPSPSPTGFIQVNGS
jgi:hypothetical protein